MTEQSCTTCAPLLSGWLFDAYPSENGMTLWFITKDGKRRKTYFQFAPSFFLDMHLADRNRVAMAAKRCGTPVHVHSTTREELFSGKLLDVFQITVKNPLNFQKATQLFEKFFPYTAFYNSNLPVEQQFFYETNLFPLAFGDYEINASNELTAFTVHDSREACEYEVPPLSIMELRLAPDSAWIAPKYQRSFQLDIVCDERTATIECSEPEEFLEVLNSHLLRCNPDILLTEYGDSLLLPKLVHLSKQTGIPLLLNRDTKASYIRKRGSSFFQYGKIVHTDGSFLLAGRWHIDRTNSFTFAEAGFDGLFEMTRLTQMCGQQQARASIGTSMSSLEYSWAYRHNVLIPSKKREAEDFKPATTLLLADRGGLIFTPPVGYYEDVAELDFVSMYPTIMVKNNISPETINCQCCASAKPENVVPELGYRICSRRRGLVASTLEPVLAKRAYYKQKRKIYKGNNDALYQKYNNLQNALKWMLVSCFGYLGYRNARFGKIEAHESVNAFSRESLLTAKEIAEDAGYTVLHGIVDCLWLKKPGATQQDYEELAAEISRRVGIDISLEGIYNWILFPASKTDASITTANHYVGWYKHGELKMRGIEARRHDVPTIVRTTQMALLKMMAQAKNIDELTALVPELINVGRCTIESILSGNVHPMELIIKRHISQEPEEYRSRTVNAIVSASIEQMGIHLLAGERIEYILIDHTGKKYPDKAKPLALYAFEDGYDREKYAELVVEAMATLLHPFGYDKKKLKELFGLQTSTAKQIFYPPKEQQLSFFYG
jgi:DNA polymerase-2